MLEKAVETVETENRPIQAACYTHKLLKMSSAKGIMIDLYRKMEAVESHINAALSIAAHQD